MASVASASKPSLIPCEKVFSVATDALRALKSGEGISEELSAKIDGLYDKVVRQGIPTGITTKGSGREMQAECAVIFRAESTLKNSELANRHLIKLVDLCETVVNKFSLQERRAAQDRIESSAPSNGEVAMRLESLFPDN